MNMNTEPATIIGAVEALLIAVVALVAVMLGWDKTTVALVVGVVGSGVALVGAILTRSKVTPVAKLLAERPPEFP